MRSIDERIGGDQAAILAACNSVKASIRVAMPGIIQSFDRSSQTVTVQLSIREKINGTDGIIDAEIPMLVDVPIVLPRAGGYALLAVPQKGDECLCVFSDLCIDSWWQSGGIQNQADMRRHDFSDGFAVLGVWSQPQKVASFPEKGIALQNISGDTGVFIADGTIDLRGRVTVNGIALEV